MAYVDDMLMISNCREQLSSVKMKLSRSFKIMDLGELDEFLGV